MPQRVELLGNRIDLVDVHALTDAVATRIGAPASVIANHNLHSLALVRHDGEMRRFYASADLVHVDGMGVVLIAKLLGVPIRREHRVAYLNWMPLLFERAHRESWRVGFIGGEQGVGEAAATKLRERYPGLHMETHHGWFAMDSEEDRAVVAWAADQKFDVLFVGMGMPRQERWIRAHRDELHAGVLLPCGAIFDYEAGNKRTAPRWLGDIGLEWLFRLVTEPRRLAHRYLIEPWPLMLPVLGAAIRRLFGRSRGDGSVSP